MMSYVLVFCLGMIATVIISPVLFSLFITLAMAFDFIDLTGRPMEPEWLTRIKRKLHRE